MPATKYSDLIVVTLGNGAREIYPDATDWAVGVSGTVTLSAGMETIASYVPGAALKVERLGHYVAHLSVSEPLSEEHLAKIVAQEAFTAGADK